MFGLHLPHGTLYKNNISKDYSNSIASVEYANYDDFISDCGYFFNEYGDNTIEKLIYVYNNKKCYEITKNEYYDYINNL